MTQTLDPQHLPHQPQQRAHLAATLKRDGLAAKARGELLTAMLHASDALLLFPNEREYLDLVDEIAMDAADPLSLVPVATGSVHVATAAVRARILMMRKELAAAVALIGRVVEVVPDVGYLDWVRRWLKPHVVESLGLRHLVTHAIKPGIEIALEVPVPPAADDPRLPNVSAAAEICAAMRAQFPDEAMLYAAEAMLRRRLGEPARTVAVATEGVQRFPNDDGQRTSLANALRDARRPDEALVQYRAALQLDPESHAPLHDAGWAFMDVGRHQEALALFQELLQRQPNYPDAELSFLYARYRVHGADQDRLALIRLRERDAGNDRAHELVGEFDPPELYYNLLPGPGDATAAATRRLLRELAPVLAHCGSGANISYELVSQHLESPSVALAFDLGVRGLGGAGAKLQIQVETVQEPDPRQDKAPVAFRLWAYEGTVATRQLPAAHPQAQQAIAAIADQPFCVEVWDPAAAGLAQQAGPSWANAFLAVLTDPPPPPAHGDFDAFQWTYRCQVATALLLSHLGPWESGAARQALYSLAYGPSDWATAAAVIALGWRARQDPALRPEVEALFAWLRGQLPKQGYTAWEAPLAHVWLGLGGHPEPRLEDLRAWLQEYRRTLPRKNRVRRPERRFGGLTLAEYAEFCWERDRIMGGGAQPGAAVSGQMPPALVQLCQRFGVPLRGEGTNAIFPYVMEWQEALQASRELQRGFAELQRNLQLEKQGVTAQEVAALDQIRDGNLDMHLRMAQAEQARRAVGEGDAGDPDPIVFPGQPVARLSDYVGIMKGMQGGNLGILGQYGLDFMSYGAIAAAWGAKMAADPTLTERFNRMMAG